MRAFLLLAALAACGPKSSVRAPIEPDAQTVSWADVRAAFDGLVCVESFPDGQGGVRELPLAGTRELCKLPAPSTALERATTKAFVEANEVIRAWPDEHRGAQEAVAAAKDHVAKLAAARAAIFSDRVLTVLQRRIGPALADEGLRCSDCPTPPEPT